MTLRLALAVIGALLVVAGAAALAADPPTASAAWFSAAAAADEPEPAVTVPLASLVGIALAVSGLAVLAGWLGFALGRRSHERHEADRRSPSSSS